MRAGFSYKEKRKRWRRFRIKVYVALFLMTLVAVGVLYVLREAQFFKIEEIEVVGLEKKNQEKFLADIKAMIAEDRLSSLLGEDNYFSWPDAINTPDLEYQEITINKNFFNRKVMINVQERTKLGIWCVNSRINADQGADKRGNIIKNQKDNHDNPRESASILRESAVAEQCYWFDNDGILFKEAPSTHGQLIYKISEKSEKYKKLGEKVTTRNLFNNFRKILDELRNLDPSVKLMEFSEGLQEFKITTNQNSEIKFSLRFDPQPNVLPALKKLLTATPLRTVQYIDLTVENKIYLKNK